MAEALERIEQDIREISRLVGQTLGILAISDGPSSATRYQSVINACSQLGERWARHLRLEAEIFPVILSCDGHFSDCLHRMQMEHEEILDRLHALGSASWPRSPQAGMNSIRIRGVETLSLLLRQLERERLTVVPLLRRWLRPEVAPVERRQVAMVESRVAHVASA